MRKPNSSFLCAAEMTSLHYYLLQKNPGWGNSGHFDCTAIQDMVALQVTIMHQSFFRILIK